MSIFRKKKNQEILKKYNQAKTSGFDFERISLFFSNTEKKDIQQSIPQNTLKDLDFEELFMYLDRTCSSIGQQYLYSLLRTIPKDKRRSQEIEKIIAFLNSHPKEKELIILELHKLNKPGAYFIQRLIYGENIEKPKWFWIIRLLANLSIASMITSFFYPAVLIIFFPVAFINTFFHYWNKSNILGYSNAIPQLLILSEIATKFLNLNIFSDTKLVNASNQKIKKVTKTSLFLKWESKITDEIGQAFEFLGDLIKGVFLIEPISFFQLLKRLDSTRSEIKDIYEAVSMIDASLSISSLRETLTYYTTPTFINNEKTFSTTGLYHPLILNPVANDLEINDQKSLLISGSNMSGKTTFIRTIGINVILAQTINTVCAKSFTLPRLNIFSAVRIADNLLDETSFYYREVKTIKKMIEACNSDFQHLFLLDELFKGTNTVERIASGKAVLSYLDKGNNIVFASTHDPELSEFLKGSFNDYHFSETIRNGSLEFDYKLKFGKLNHTNAIKILEINGFPEEITNEAKTIAKKD